MTELTLVEKLRAFAMAEARHGIGRQRKDLFNEAAEALEAVEKQRDNLLTDRDAWKQRAWAAEQP